jgi:hypothetical protein
MPSCPLRTRLRSWTTRQRRGKRKLNANVFNSIQSYMGDSGFITPYSTGFKTSEASQKRIRSLRRSITLSGCVGRRSVAVSSTVGRYGQGIMSVNAFPGLPGRYSPLRIRLYSVWSWPSVVSNARRCDQEGEREP